MSLSHFSISPLSVTPLEEGDVVFKRHARAIRYLARIDNDGAISITVPRGGNKRGALKFANQHRDWLREEQAKALAEMAAKANHAGLRIGDSILFRGIPTKLKLEKDWGRPVLRVGEERIYIADEGMELSRPLAAHFKELAKVELPKVVTRLAARFDAKVSKVAVRDQKTRWGSCSSSRAISLNWRLILAPNATRDYVIIHELMHLKRFDHSPAFWRLVEKACPNYRQHEKWLESHQDDLTW